MGRDIRSIDLRNITVNFMFFAEVGAVGRLRKFVPLAGEHTGAADRFEAQSQTANAGEEVDKTETPISVIHTLLQ